MNAARPNVLVILVDQWRASAFGHGTDPVVRTPNLDRLAAEGIRFERSYATNPICAPNRATLMTSRYPHQHGVVVNNLQLPPQTGPWLGDPFVDAGYATHYLGKSHLDGPSRPGYIPPGWRRRGFSTMQGFNRGHRYYDSQTFDDDGTLMSLTGFESHHQAEHARAFMTAHRDEPFFCFLSWGPPHTPYDPPAGFGRLMEPGATLEWRDNVPSWVREDPEYHRDLAGYYGLCEALDAELGEMMDFLDTSGLADDTIVVFTSDHGDMLGSHGKRFKSWPEEESLRVPLFVRWPRRIDPDQVVEDLISTIDLMPTILGLCDLPVPDHCEGLDFSAGMVDGAGTFPSRDVYAEGCFHKAANWRALVSTEYKYVQYSHGATHLYQLATDPYELRDLVDDPAHRRARQQMDQELRRRAREVDDPFPTDPVPALPEYPA